jgi:RND family efflux transporter MFP subunit
MNQRTGLFRLEPSRVMAMSHPTGFRPTFLLLTAFGLLTFIAAIPPRAEEPAATGQAKKRPVRVERVKRGEVRCTTTQPGSVQAFESAELFARVSGYLKEQKVDIGDRVKRGELLAVIDAPELFQEAELAARTVDQARLAVRQAEARLKTAEGDLETARAAVAPTEADAARSTASLKSREQLAMTSAMSRVLQARADLEHARSGVPIAETNLNRAKVMIDYTRIVSPYNGVVTFRGLHPGDFARAGDAGSSIPLLRVARTDKVRVVTHVPDRDVPHLNRGDVAEITIDALPGQTFRGRVARFAESEDPKTRTMRTEIDLDNNSKILREGMYGVVTIVLDELPPGLMIPTTALVSRGADGSSSCFRIVDGRSVLTPIKVGPDNGRRAQVVSGLQEGDLVVVHPGDDGVTDGKPVAIEDR